MTSRGTGTRRALPGSPFNQPPAVAIVASYAMSDRVSHDRYGLGTVVGTENGNAAVLVDFGPEVLRVALPTTKMVKLWAALCSRLFLPDTPDGPWQTELRRPGAQNFLTWRRGLDRSRDHPRVGQFGD